jgi:hypothetical protein
VLANNVVDESTLLNDSLTLSQLLFAQSHQVAVGLNNTMIAEEDEITKPTQASPGHVLLCGHACILGVWHIFLWLALPCNFVVTISFPTRIVAQLHVQKS